MKNVESSGLPSFEKSVTLKLIYAFHTWVCSAAFLQGEALKSFVPNDTNGRKFPIFIAVVVAFIEIQLELGVLARVDVQLNGFIVD